MIHFLALLKALFSGKACQCMRLGRVLGAAFGLVLCGSAALAEHPASVTIGDADRGQISAAAHFWHEKPGKATVEQASEPSASARYMPLAEETMFDLKPKDNLWIRLDLEINSTATDHIILWIPLPLLDSVTLYQKVGDGKWKASKAGDRIAVASWPEPGRYPRFHIELPQGKSSIYLQVQGSTPLSLPIHVGTEVQAQAADREGFLGMGLIVGVLLTLVLMCMVTAYTYKDSLYLLYGFYMLLLILAVGAYTGLSAYLLWNHSPVWADAAQGALAILTAGGALYFIEAMLGGREFARRLSVVLLSLGAASLPLALLYYAVPRSIGVIILGVFMTVITTIGLTLASRAWRRGDQVGKWVFFAYAPLALAVLMALARAYGWISYSWLVQYGVVVALLIEAPTMMAALHVRSRERHEISTREQAMTTQDALTGLLKEHIFDDRLKQTMARSIKRREDAAVIVISLVNYEAIAQAYGAPVAEQSILRAVIKLRKVLRDVETVARIGTSHFGLILEGVVDRSRITEVGARLIAQGLMPLPGLVPEVTLQFHIAAVLMRDMPAEQRDIKDELLAVLSQMSHRTRRPIRFWELTTTSGTPLAAIPPASTPVDEMTALVRAASLRSSTPMTMGPSDVPSSGSGWDSTNQENSAIMGGDTVPLPRSQM